MNAAIEVTDLKKAYASVQAVAGLSFAVAPGEIFGLLGPNGAGKTTTVECLLGLRQPDSGRVRLLGLEHAGQSRAIRARLGTQLQTTGLLPQLTVREQVSTFAGLFPRPRPVDEVLAELELSDLARARTRALSGGQRQRLAIALALVNDPDLIFLDEPTTGLDPAARRALWDVVRARQRAGRTVLLTTHYLEEAEALCDRVAIVDHGRLIELDSPAALIHKHFKETAIEFAAPAGPARERLAGLPGVSQALFENGTATLYAADVPQAMAGLFALAGADSLPLANLVVRQASLEDVFLKLTGRRIRQ